MVAVIIGFAVRIKIMFVVKIIIGVMVMVKVAV